MSHHDSVNLLQQDHAISGKTARADARGSDGFWIAEDYAMLMARLGLDSLEALLGYAGGERLDKPGLANWRQRWRMALEDEGASSVLYMKRFASPPRWATRAVKRSGSGARSLAGNEREWIRRLRADGIPCADVVAFGEEVEHGREVRSVIVTAAVAGRSLESWAKEWTPTDRATIRMLLGATAAMAARLHNHGYVHRDLYLSHVFFDPSRPPEKALCLIDLQRVIRPSWRFSRWRVKDLAALNYSTPAAMATRTDRLRWLRYYLGVKKVEAAGKQLAYRVIGKTMRVARRESRRRTGWAS